MKTLVAVLVLALSSPLFAAEDCPVSKISLARGLACEVYRLADQAAEKDTKIDQICLKLGRVSAIMRRTQGQLPDLKDAPIPPVEYKQRAIEIEGFCGVGIDTTLPRGLLNPDFITGTGLKSYMSQRLEEMSQWITDNKDIKGCPAPAELSVDAAAHCLK